MENTITLYSTQWCGDCRVAKHFLKQHNVAYEEIDIDVNNSAAQQVIEWSGGRRVIPTFVIRKCESSQPVILHNPPITMLAQEIGV